MKKFSISCALLSLAPALASASGLQFDLGGTGRDGPLNITTDTTIPLPADGVLQYTTVNVAAGVTLRFSPNARNTGVVIVATGDVTIDGTIDVSGTTAGVPGPGGQASPPAYSNNSPMPLTPDSLSSGATGGYFYVNPLGGSGGNTSYVQCGANNYSVGPRGGGGGGAIFIYSNTAFKSSNPAATINAAGGAASTALAPSGCQFAMAPTGLNGRPLAGGDGSVHIVAPTVDAASLAIYGGYIGVNRLFDVGMPNGHAGDFSPRAITVSANLETFVPNPLAVSIYSIDGTVLPANTESYALTYTPAATSTSVVVTAKGCAGTLHVNLGSGYGGILGRCQTSNDTFHGVTNVSVTYTCPLISPFAGYPSGSPLLAWGTCGP